MYYVSALNSSTKVPIKEPPAGATYSDYNLTKSGRTADGTMTMELVAKKRKFEFSFDVLSSRFLSPILAVIDNPANMFFTFYYPDADGEHSCTVYVGDIAKIPWRKGPTWYWKNVKFDFIEK